MLAKKPEIVFQLTMVLPTADELANLLVERLDANLELQRARRKFCDDLSQRFRQSVRNHFKMEKVAGTISFQKELQDRLAALDVEIESAIDKLELLHPAFDQPLQLLQ